MGGEFSGAIADIAWGLRLAPLWVSLGWDQTVARFRRTVLGPFWLSANLIAIALAMSYIFGGMMGGGYAKVFPVLISGLLSWAVIGGPITEAAGVFIGSAGLMTSQKLPLNFHVIQKMNMRFINFVAQLLALWIIFLLFRIGSLPAWPILIGLPLVMANSFFLSIIIAAPSTRFRDVTQLTGFVMQIMFFITPVFWAPDRMNTRYRFILDYNPFAHMVELVRQPLLGRTPALVHYAWALGTGILFGGLAILTLALYRKRIVFWL